MFDAVSESDAASFPTGSANESSFQWVHIPPEPPRGVIVFVFELANEANTISVTYGGHELGLVPGGRAVDTADEPGACTAYFRGSGLPGNADPTTIIVQRVNNATVMYAAAITFRTSALDTRVVGTPVLLQDNGTLDEQSVDSGSAFALRVAAINSGFSSLGLLPVGAHSLITSGADFGLRVCSSVVEFNGSAIEGGVGNRLIGWTTGSSEDRAAVHLGIVAVETKLVITRSNIRL